MKLRGQIQIFLIIIIAVSVITGGIYYYLSKQKITCQNECSSANLKKCSNNGYQICGNFDEDECLEWSSIVNCPTNRVCQNGECVSMPIVQCSSGPCCDISTKKFKPATYKCQENIKTEYGCPWGSNAGNDVGIRYQNRYCSGSSANCDGALKWGDWVIYKDCGLNEACVNGVCKLLTCSDGTPYGQCSTNKPKYCDNGNLIDNCSICGCPVGYKCKNYTCQKLPVANIELQNNLVILKNKNDVTYTFEECKVPGKIAVDDSKVMEYFYSKFNDDYDYAIIVTNFEACRAVHQQNIKNEIAGIGLSTKLDSSMAYGSKGRLKGVIRMGSIGGTTLNSRYTFLHEFGHNWGVFINSELKDEFNHWRGSAFLDRCDVMSATGSYYDYIEGKYVIHNCSIPEDQWKYSYLMQHLMGLLSKEDISNEKFHLMEWDDSLQGYKIKKTFTINDIISLNGERIPTPATSQKEFSVAFILITDENGASSNEISTAQQTMYLYGNWFHEATDNRASINFFIKQ